MLTVLYKNKASRVKVNESIGVIQYIIHFSIVLDIQNRDLSFSGNEFFAMRTDMSAL